MAQVVFLRGVNVGGRRQFRPAVLAKTLGLINIGAAGTFVAHRRVSRAELARHLPFECEIAICDGRDILRLLSHPFDDDGPGVTRFVSVLARRPRSIPAMPVVFPERGDWLLKVVACDGRFVLGVYRRHMKVIGYLGALDELFGAPLTTRNWNTLAAIARALRP